MLPYLPPWTAADRVELERKAALGDTDSEVELADCYHDGAHGFQVNLKLAARWYLQGAKRGRPRAQATIGEMYEFGEGVPQDHQKALDWIRRGTVVIAAVALGPPGLSVGWRWMRSRHLVGLSDGVRFTTLPIDSQSDWRGFVADSLTQHGASRKASGAHFDAEQRACHHASYPQYDYNYC